jgi:hypothetical protein
MIGVDLNTLLIVTTFFYIPQMSNQIKRFRILTWVEMTKLLISIVFWSDHFISCVYCSLYTAIKQTNILFSQIIVGFTPSMSSNIIKCCLL